MKPLIHPRIHEVEALRFTMPYMSKGAWKDFLK